MEKSRKYATSTIICKTSAASCSLIARKFCVGWSPISASWDKCMASNTLTSLWFAHLQKVSENIVQFMTGQTVAELTRRVLG